MNHSQTQKAQTGFLALAVLGGLMLTLIWGAWGSVVGGLIAWAFCSVLAAIGLFFIGLAVSPLLALALAINAAKPQPRP